jgi:hypothetical protein
MKRFYLKKGNINWRYDFPPSQPNIWPSLKIAEEKKKIKENKRELDNHLLFCLYFYKVLLHFL